MILTPYVVDTRDETDLLTQDFRSKIIGAMSKKNIRTLYNLEEKGKPAESKVDTIVPEAEGN